MVHLGTRTERSGFVVLILWLSTSIVTIKLLERLLEFNVVDSLDVNGCMFSVIYLKAIQIRLYDDMPQNLGGKRSGRSQMRGLEMEIDYQIFLGTAEVFAQQDELRSLIGWQPLMSKSPSSLL